MKIVRQTTRWLNGKALNGLALGAGLSSADVAMVGSTSRWMPNAIPPAKVSLGLTKFLQTRVTLAHV